MVDGYVVDSDSEALPVGQARPGDTRQRILDAAAEVMRAKGYAGTRLSDVAKVARLQVATIYYYFASREDVIEEVVRAGQQRTIDHVRDVLDGLPEGTDALARLECAVGAHLDVVLTSSNYAAASIRNFGQLPEVVRARQMALRREYGVLWRDLVAQATRAGAIDPDLDPFAVQQLILGALNWTTEWWDVDRGDASIVIAHAQGLISRGIAAS